MFLALHQGFFFYSFTRILFFMSEGYVVEKFEKYVSSSSAYPESYWNF